jgi:hypothetical protein
MYMIPEENRKFLTKTIYDETSQEVVHIEEL